MTKGETAKQYFLNGYTCAQAVMAAFCGDFGINPDVALKIASGFGGGIGRLREVCGAFSGAVMVLNLACGFSTPETGKKKRELYAHIQQLAKLFSADNGSIICHELLGLKKGASAPAPDARTNEYYATRPCAELVEYAANLVEQYLVEICKK